MNLEKKTVDLCENGRREIDIYLGIVDEVGGHIDLLETNDLDIDSDCENDDCNSDNNDDIMKMILRCDFSTRESFPVIFSKS